MRLGQIFIHEKCIKIENDDVARKTECKDFSCDLWNPGGLDGKFRGEIWQFEGRELANLWPRFAVRIIAICKLLIISVLINASFERKFCKDFLPIIARWRIQDGRIYIHSRLLGSLGERGGRLEACGHTWSMSLQACVAIGFPSPKNNLFLICEIISCN